MKYKSLGFLAWILLVLAGCIVVESIYWASAKLTLQNKIAAEVNLFLEQQQQLFLRFSKQLQPAIKNKDFINISQQIRIFEDQIFMLAKQGWTVPIRVQWVSLNVPPKIITGEGSVDSQRLVPDENYYMQMVNNPHQLQVSKTYTKHAMPEYNLQNIGLAAEFANHGLLDSTVPLDILSAHVKQNLGAMSKYFSVSISSLQQPSIITSNKHFWNCIIIINIIILLICSLFYWLALWGLKIYRAWREKCIELKLLMQKVDDLSHLLNLHKKAANTHMKYSKILNQIENAKQNCVVVTELFQDMQAMSAELALMRNIKINFLQPTESQILLVGNRVHLIRALYGILHEVLQQLPANSIVEIQATVINLNSGDRRLVFKFTDNGFYKELSDKVWVDLQQLVAMEGGVFEHIHSAYNGNTIRVEFSASLGNNIIQLEHYLAKV